MSSKDTLSRRNLLFGAIRRFKPEDEGKVEEKKRKVAQKSTQSHESGESLLAKGDYEQAATEFRAALGHDQENIEARARLGFCLYRMEKFTQAECELVRVTRKQEDRMAALYLGLSRARLGKTEQALNAWESVFTPDQPMLMREINLHKALFETGESIDPHEMANLVEAAVSASYEG